MKQHPKGRATRRELLQFALAGGTVVAAIGAVGVRAGTRTGPGDDVPRFQQPLPIPPVLKPTRVENGCEYFDIEQCEGTVELIPGRKTTVWGYNGSFPGPTIRARRGTPTVVRHVNRLRTPTVVHLHGGRTPADSDGFPTDVIVPQGFSPEDFPICRSPTSEGSPAAPRVLSGPARTYTYPNDQRAATLWYHDHAMEGTGRNTYMGLAGFYLIEDAHEQGLGLPSGRYDVPLMICLRSFSEDGKLLYEPHGHAGADGDVVLVNGAPWPRMKVERRKYRLRILNACNATVMDLVLGDGSRPFTLVGTDGGLVESPVPLSHLPLSMAERAEVVIDFAEFAEGSSVLLHDRRGKGRLAQLMRFDVIGATSSDDSQVPETLSAIEPLRREDAVRTREFTFGAKPEFRFAFPPIYWAINGRRFDPERVDAAPRLGDVEIWRFVYEKTLFPTRAHPAHLHLVHFQVLDRNGSPPLAHERGWKDTVSLEGGEVVTVIARFDGYRGRFLMHCHNLEHEDHDMMSRFDVV